MVRETITIKFSFGFEHFILNPTIPFLIPSQFHTTASIYSHFHLSLSPVGEPTLSLPVVLEVIFKGPTDYVGNEMRQAKKGMTRVADEKITSNFLVGDSVIEILSMTIKKG